MWIVVSICISISIDSSYSKMNFTGDKVFSVTPSSEYQVEFLRDLQDNAHIDQIDMWVEPTTVSQPVTIRVPASHTESFEHKLNAQEIRFHSLSNNLQQWIEAEEKENPPDGGESGLFDDEEFDLDTYHTFPYIREYLHQISEKYPEIATLENIGTTYNGNSILGLKIGINNSTKPAIWIDAGMHAREWIAPATAIYMISQFIKGFEEENEGIKNLLETFDWYIFPVMNPDGYIYTWEENRMWKKNRAPDKNSTCVGVDSNRNFDVAFGVLGSAASNDSCSSGYQGKCAFSEAESKALRDGVLKIGDRLQAYVTLHAYSQLIMYPYGYELKRVPNYDDTAKLVYEMAKAIYLTHGKTYKYGPIANTAYLTSGCSIDWVKDVAKVKYSLAIEERDTGKRGFILNKSEIIPTSEEIFAAMKVLAKTLKNEMAQDADV